MQPKPAERFFCFRKTIALAVILTHAFSLVTPLPKAHASELPSPGTIIASSQQYLPATLTGMTLFPDNPLRFDFIIDSGDAQLSDDELSQESQKLISYFLATLTVPEKEMWVNLSPDQEDKIMADGLSHTMMGKDMLAQDYLLKQLSASLMSPENKYGQKFWEKVYSQAHQKYGTTDIPTEAFTRVWIVPNEASVYTHGTSVFVAKSHLKVLMEEDYEATLAVRGRAESPFGGETLNQNSKVAPTDSSTQKETNALFREILLPEIEREVNEGKNFAPLRQVYHSMILASWYKKNLKESLLSEVYVDQNKVSGVDVEDKEMKLKIYDQYMAALKKGVYHKIYEFYDPEQEANIPRQYFTGGQQFIELANTVTTSDLPPASLLEKDRASLVNVSTEIKLEDQAMEAPKKDFTLNLDQLKIAAEAFDIGRNILNKHKEGNFLKRLGRKVRPYAAMAGMIAFGWMDLFTGLLPGQAMEVFSNPVMIGIRSVLLFEAIGYFWHRYLQHPGWASRWMPFNIGPQRLHFAHHWHYPTAQKGTAVDVSGMVYITREGEEKQLLNPGEPVQSGDLIEVGEAGQANLLFEDGNKLYLRPKTPPTVIPQMGYGYPFGLPSFRPHDYVDTPGSGDIWTLYAMIGVIVTGSIYIFQASWLAGALFAGAILGGDVIINKVMKKVVEFKPFWEREARLGATLTKIAVTLIAATMLYHGPATQNLLVLLTGIRLWGMVTERSHAWIHEMLFAAGNLIDNFIGKYHPWLNKLAQPFNSYSKRTRRMHFFDHHRDEGHTNYSMFLVDVSDRLAGSLFHVDEKTYFEYIDRVKKHEKATGLNEGHFSSLLFLFDQMHNASTKRVGGIIDLKNNPHVRVVLSKMMQTLRYLKDTDEDARIWYERGQKIIQKAIEHDQVRWPELIEFVEDDKAVLSQEVKPGGVDFNAEHLQLKEQGDSIDINFTNPPSLPIDPESIQGAAPIILNIAPITNFKFLLGLQDSETELQLSQI